MGRLLAPTNGVEARGDYVLRPPPLDEIVLNCQHKETLCCLLVVLRKPQSGGQLCDVPLTVGKGDLARFLAKTKP